MKRVARAFRALGRPTLDERVRTEIAGDPSDIVEAAPRTLARLFELRRVRCADRLIDLQQHAGQGLPELVVKLAREAPALGLLRAHGATRTVAALVLQPLEHVVEGPGQLTHLLGRPPRLQARARRQRVDRAHETGQALQRRERATDQ